MRILFFLIAFCLSTPGFGGLVPGGAGSPANFPDGFTSSGTTQVSVEDAQTGDCTNSNVCSGRYTPTFASLNGLTSPVVNTPNGLAYTRLGDVVTISGSLSLTCSNTTTAPSMTISLPIALVDTMTGTQSASGVMSVADSTYVGGRIRAEPGSDTLIFLPLYSANCNGLKTWHFIARYTLSNN